MSVKKVANRKLFRYIVPLILGFGILVGVLSTFAISGGKVDASSDSSYLNFQARLLNSSGSIVPDGTTYSVEFKIYNAATEAGGHTPDQGACTYNGGTTDSTCLWKETWSSNVTVQDGYLSVYLGSVTAFPSTINWEQPLWLSMRVYNSGTSSWDAEMSPRIQLTALPYAFISSQLANNYGGARQTLGWSSSAMGTDTITLPDNSGTVCLQQVTCIQNQSTTAQSGNIDIQDAGGSGTVTGVLEAGTTSPGDILDLENNGGHVVDAFGSTGYLTLGLASTTPGEIIFNNGSGSHTVTLEAPTSNPGSSYILSLPSTAPSTSQCLETDSSTASQLDFTSCGGSGVTTVGTIDGGTDNSNGAYISISGTTIYMQTASTSNVGLINTGTQSIAGNKTFTGTVTLGTSSAQGEILLNTGAGDTVSIEAPSSNPTSSYVLSLPSTNPGNNQCLETDSSTATQLDFTACVTTVGSVGSPSSNGATITGTTIYLDTASAADPGLVSTTTQTFAGNKTLTGQTTLNNGSGELSLVVGADGTTTGQVYIGGSIPTSAASSTLTTACSGGGNAPYSVFVSGNYAYVAESGSTTASGIESFDVTNPASAACLNNLQENGYVMESVYVQGNYAYTANESNNSIEVFNVSNPSSITAVNASVSTGSGSNPDSIVVSGKYAYVTYSGSSFGDLAIWDVSNPSNPTFVNKVLLGSAGSSPDSVYVQGQYAYVAATPSGTPSLYAVNISNPNSLSAGTADSLVSGGSSATAVYVQGRYAYLTETGSGTNNFLVVCDVSNPASLTGTYVSGADVSTGSNSQPSSLYVQGRLAYVTLAGSSFNELEIYDVSTPTSAPVAVGNAPTGTAPQSVFVQGRYAYVVNAGSSGTNHSTLQVFDIGGTYTQQLQAGGAEFGTLQVDGNSNVSGNQSVAGGLNVGGSTDINGSLGVAGVLNVNATSGSVQMNSGTQNAGTIGTWLQTGNNLSAALSYAAKVTYNGYIYELGGTTTNAAAGAVKTIYYAPISSNGSIGAWATNPTDLTNATGQVYGAQAVAYNGYMYVWGGGNTSGNSPSTATVYYASINPNGTIGSWSSAGNNPANGGFGNESFVYNGYVYQIGSETAGSTISAANAATNVYYASINPNGTIGSWSSAGNTSYAARYLPATVQYNGYVYQIGGENTGGTAQSTVQLTQITTATTPLATWTTTQALPQTDYGETAFVYNNYMYVIGGDYNGSVSTTTLSDVVQTNGTLANSWTAQTSLVTAVMNSTSVAYNGNVYELGGGTTTATNANISNTYYAALYNSGTNIFNISSSGAQIASTINSTSTFQVQNAVGINMLQADTTDGSIVLANGTDYLGAIGNNFVATNGLPASLTDAVSTIYNGYIYVIGSTTGSYAGASTTVYYAPINSNGTISSWSTTSLNAAVFEPALTALNGYFYAVGGENTSGTVQSAMQYYTIGASGALTYVGTTATAMTTAAWGVSAVAATVSSNNYLYIIGGCTSSSSASCTAETTTATSIQLSSTTGNTTGSMSSSTALPIATGMGAIAISSGYLYYLGGYTGSSPSTTTDVFISQLGAGSVGSWNNTSSNYLTTAVAGEGAIAANNYIYVFDGTTTSANSGATGLTYSTSIIGNTTLGAWTATTNGPALAYTTADYYNGNAFIIGGGNGTYAENSSVYYVLIYNGSQNTITNNGFGVLVGNTINSYNAFAVQNASGTNVISVNTITGALVVGTANELTSSIVLNNASGSGSITLTAANPGISNYTLTAPNVTGTLCSSGNASTCNVTRTSQTVLIPAEYAGAIINSNGLSSTADIGTMTTGFCTSSCTTSADENYYSWTSAQNANESYYVIVSIPIPNNYSSAITLTVDAQQGASANTTGTIGMTLFGTGGGSSVGCGSAVTPTTTWTAETCTITGGTFTPGGDATLEIELNATYASSTESILNVGNITMTYTSSY
ncbi:MAG TPA: hypothetical protein VMR34_03795 [Candidatus Saccharimonadales bacterium]|nr:hypothetical protein [Candidatus Saccharimonadales bacterium]